MKFVTVTELIDAPPDADPGAEQKDGKSLQGAWRNFRVRRSGILKDPKKTNPPSECTSREYGVLHRTVLSSRY
ncbi:hypothetical protein TNCV_3653841 [Trichonephila clavipes]|nr:hypothetical protein TNCV_3653841 [Trichonephila clavipes]